MHPTRLLLTTTLWLATLANLPLWLQLSDLSELQNWRGLGFGCAMVLIIFSTLCALLSLVPWRWTLKPILVLCLIAAALASHFMLAYGVVIDSTMMLNVLQTDLGEALDLLSWRFFITFALLGLLPSAWVWRTPILSLSTSQRVKNKIILLLLSLGLLTATLLLFFQDFSSVMRNHPRLRYLINPLNSFYALGNLAAKPFHLKQLSALPLGEDAQIRSESSPTDKPPLLVLVLGETARAKNFSLNGYPRPTNPQLAQENIISQRNAWACGTSTAASLPCLFSHLGRVGYDQRKNNFQGLLDVLQHAGLAVLWIDNQSGCKGVCDRIPSVNTSRLHDLSLCPNGACFDAIMLQEIDQRITKLPTERRDRGVVLVLHQMGSHGPAYFKRSPSAFKKFLPECRSNALQTCSQDEVINAYDNTILYTDHFLASTLDWLKRAEQASATAMVYVSDHGESLGENNLYLHGLPYIFAPDVQKQVPWMTWLSSSFEKQSRVKTSCLQQQVDTQISHDNYFHSILGLLGISTEVYREDLDIYARCRGVKTTQP